MSLTSLHQCLSRNTACLSKQGGVWQPSRVGYSTWEETDRPNTNVSINPGTGEHDLPERTVRQSKHAREGMWPNAGPEQTKIVESNPLGWIENDAYLR